MSTTTTNLLSSKITTVNSFGRNFSSATVAQKPASSVPASLAGAASPGSAVTSPDKQEGTPSKSDGAPSQESTDKSTPQADVTPSESIAGLAVVPQGFIFTKSIKVFGGLDGHLYTSSSSTSGDINELVCLDDTTLASLANVVPHIKDTALSNVVFAYNSKAGPGGDPGLWMVCDMGLDGSLTKAGSMVTKLFGVQPPKLKMKALLSKERDWETPLGSQTLHFIGNLNGQASCVDGRLIFASNTLTCFVDNTSSERAFEFSGLAMIKLESTSHSATNVNYTIKKSGAAWNIELLSTSAIQNAFGVPGLQLQNLTLSSDFDSDKFKDTFAFTVKATLAGTCGGKSVQVTGDVSKDDWAFSVTASQWDLSGVIEFYQTMFGTTLASFKEKLVLSKAQMTIAKGHGIQLLGTLEIETYQCVTACLKLDSDGITISGNVDSIHVAGDTTLTAAKVDILIHKNTHVNRAREVEIKFSGQLLVANKTITASLWLDRQDDGKVWETIYGEFELGFRLSQLNKKFQGSFADDIVLDKVCAIWTNAPHSATGDDVSAPIPVAFDLRPGLQIAAHVTSSIGRLDKALNNGRETIGITLVAYLGKSGYEIELILATSQRLSMHKGRIQSSDITVMIGTDGEDLPIIEVISTYDIKTSATGPMLHAFGSLLVGVDKADAAIGMHNSYWKNPLGISQNLTLGPEMLLGVGIVYESPVWPSTVSLAFDLQIGRVTGRTTLQISDDPTEEVFIVEIDKLGLADVVSMAGTIFEKNWTLKNDDILTFEQISMYLSSGAYVGPTYYPAGFKYSCDVDLFGIHGTCSVAVDKSEKKLAASGHFRQMAIGPITLSGAKANEQPGFDLDFGETLWKLSVNGGIHIEPLKMDLLASFIVSLKDNPELSLSAEFDWSSALKATLLATAKGGTFKSFKDLKSLEFDIDFEMQQEIVQDLLEHLHSQFVAAKEALDTDLNTAKAKLASVQAEHTAKIVEARRNLDVVEGKLEADKQQINAALDTKRKECEARLEAAKVRVEETGKALAAKIQSAEDNLQHAKDKKDRDAAQKQQALEDARRKTVTDVAAAQRNVQNLVDSMAQKFGSIDQKLTDAQNVLSHAEKQYSDAHWWQKAYLFPPLEAARLAVKLVQDIIEGSAYIAEKGALVAARATLAAVILATSTAVTEAEAAVALVQRVEDAAIVVATEALRVARTSDLALTNSNIAKAAFNSIEAEIDKLVRTAEEETKKAEDEAEKLGLYALRGALTTLQAVEATAVAVMTKAIDAAEEVGDAVLNAAAWAAAHGDVFDVKRIKVTGDLGKFSGGGCLDASLDIVIMGKAYNNLSISLKPGGISEFIHEVFLELMKRIKADFSFSKKPPAIEATPTAQPVKPIADPAKPIADPAKPVSEPAKPISEPTKQIEEPTKPIAEPTKPISEPAKAAVSQPGDHNTGATTPSKGTSSTVLPAKSSTDDIGEEGKPQTPKGLPPVAGSNKEVGEPAAAVKISVPPSSAAQPPTTAKPGSPGGSQHDHSSGGWKW